MSKCSERTSAISLKMLLASSLKGISIYGRGGGLAGASPDEACATSHSSAMSSFAIRLALFTSELGRNSRRRHESQARRPNRMWTGTTYNAKLFDLNALNFESSRSIYHALCATDVTLENTLLLLSTLQIWACSLTMRLQLCSFGLRGKSCSRALPLGLAGLLPPVELTRLLYTI